MLNENTQSFMSFDRSQEMRHSSMEPVTSATRTPNLQLRFTQKKDKKRVILPKFPEDRPKYKVMNPDTYEMVMKYCVIRPDKAIISKARVETPWNVKMGIFKDYLHEENPKTIEACFIKDWENMKKLKYK